MSLTTFHNNWTGWDSYEVGTGVVATLISQATFLSEQVDAHLPEGHTGNVLKIEFDTPSITGQIRSPNSLGLDHSTWNNIVVRGYLPKDQLSNVGGAEVISFSMLNNSGAASRELDMAFSDSTNAIHNYGQFQHIEDPNDSTWKYTTWKTDAGSYDNTDLWRMIVKTTSDAGVSASNKLTFYMFDLVRDVDVGTPEVFLSADDNTDDHYDLMFPTLKTYSIPMSLSVIPEILDTPGYITSAERDEMIAHPLVDQVGHSNAAFGDSTPSVTPSLKNGDEIQTYLDDTLLPDLYSSVNKRSGGHQVHVWTEGRYRYENAEFIWPRLLQNGFKMARRARGGFNADVAVGGEGTYMVMSYALGQNSGQCADAADVDLVLEKAKAMNVSVGFHAHQLVAGTPSGGTQFSNSEFTTVCSNFRTEDDAGNIDLKSLAKFAVDRGYAEVSEDSTESGKLTSSIIK